ncbi:hypothetical protein HN51_029169 [Arachis hypogaea]|uniref:Bifunctional inhibitor/plant lipid transfer protein/seed storage helical domain-containing protein n=1 Tax=Arachis hypogaea TaxID=3818 RepID=A0A445BFU3_ARAHY|nr:non-specific lipid-transfer protein-like protein At2g13820 [Arachis hypogaea]RYR37491.1 hypothetical protein Ahy_A09g042370 [Arachis hypogaea]
MVACVVALVLGMLMVTAPSYAQISTPCNVSALSTLFTPCAGFLTNSSGNGTSPTAQCCGALKSLTSGGMNCLCLLLTAGIPFRIPVNRSLAISLPRACNMPAVPVQCKASGTPLPAPGPVAFGPSPSSPSGFTPTPSPQASSSSAIPPSPSNPPSLAPESDTSSSSPPLQSPASPSVDSGTTSTPASSTGSSRPGLTPSSAIKSLNAPPSLLFIALGVAVLKFY